ncbi:hypothetical protein H5410_008824 [Solanum commersonii]|uniref:Uncharacterized protein n=1 Tax=Solanum commersonii TaxID=4109 RepID=A0A9J6AG21_SOLCO|nr:hypothetical protein H5410_008824 [Solanum commersonii]
MFPPFFLLLLSIVMGPVIDEGSVEEVRVEIKFVEEVKIEIDNVEEEIKRKLEKSTSDGNSKEEIPPLDIKDYEELRLIIDLGELGDSSYENAGMDFDSMFPDFFAEDEEKLMEITPYVDPARVLSSNFSSLIELEKWMEIPPPEESISFPTGADFDFELMEWIWELYSTFDEDFLFYNL